jgi:5-oxopent-3-ene-1,2,5-tricarboxylate decarboxylase/2-hydroxyhepta-2,4-diene-1,7-dioate isomerase
MLINAIEQDGARAARTMGTMISGTAYGTVLNDRRQLGGLSAAFLDAPYKAPPRAPVLYIKPRTCFGFGGAPVVVPSELDEVEAAATVGLLFSADVVAASPAAALAGVGAACLALDVAEPHASFYRPAIRERCRDGFLPLGGFASVPADLAAQDIVTFIDGQEAHRWSLSRLARPIAELVSEISGFMSLRAGDLLLVGLPGDAPRVSAGRRVEVRMAEAPTLSVPFVAEDCP